MAESLCCSPITASLINYVVLVQLLNHVQLLPTRLTPGLRQASLFFTISLSLLKLMCIELMMPSSHLILYSNKK